ncbi:hypothetical protein A1O1_07231 [Capronia coronata CBS 617.96]|uniref:DNA-directed RNA polymerase subunit n=1 Tax=Capronia coronata CBS 617.96 TaxID=1182541 RepID=W9XTP1_9EURO|nr:uncharacterized protein A1O1_07231 [Capronia coronata CBS 617.96]EXJ83608.1 hypothetical protein A1O1_07231 [Capronia coronata CBS 617.96]
MSSSKDLESVTTPKKRKHRAEEKELSRKKKKQRTEERPQQSAEPNSPTATVVASQSQLSTETDGAQKKKKKKAKDKDTHKQTETEPEPETVQVNGKSPEPEDIELVDAPSPEAEPTVDEPPATTSLTAVDGEDGATVESEMVADLLDSADPTSFYSTRLSLYLSIPAIALETSSSSILATHLAPLLLTYFPPAQGIVLGFSDPVLSATPDTDLNRPLLPPSDGDFESQAEVLAKTADEAGVCWVWLTATFLVFRPERGDELYGWTNVTSEGFVGLVSYNYFQTAVAKNRIPQDWTWTGPSREDTVKNKRKGKKARLRDEDGASSQIHGDDNEHDHAAAARQEDDHGAVSQARIVDDGGFFVDANDGSKVQSTQKFRVVDAEIVPGHDRHKWSLQIEGTLLDDEAEQKAVEEERARFELSQHRSRSYTPGDPSMLMSGALARSREGSVASRLSGPVPSQRHRVAY